MSISLENFKQKFVVIIVLTMILGTLSGFQTASAKTAKEKRYSGEELFAGLILGQGEYAEKFDTVWTEDMLAKANTKESKRDAKLIIKEMNKVDKTYFDKLEKAVYSKDFKATYDTLVAGGVVLKKVLDNVGVEEVDKDKGVSTNCLTTTFAGLATGVLVLVVTGAALVNTYWVVNYTKLKTKSSTPGTGNLTLDQELFTKQMIETAIN